ncbi:sugar ABC transporter permease [Eubacteriales bacterium OttesenSCG-928-N13]|nr:sugar ABC transporter permease [Eubacteriales bacterium OttesenSCG-928-N13]
MQTGTRRVASMQDKKRQSVVCAVVFLIPAFFFLGVYMFYSIFSSFEISLYNWNGIGPRTEFAGLANWRELIKDYQFLRAMGNNLIIVVLSVVIQMPIGMALAYILDVGGKKLNFFKVAWFLPLLMSSVAIGFLFKHVLDPNFGLISGVMQLFGASGGIDFLGDPNKALYAVVVVICWQFIPFYMVYYLAGLGGLPEEVYEASIIDGATRAQYFFRCALPQLMPTIKSAVTMSMVGSLKYFDLIYVMTGGGPSGSTELMATYMYRNSFAMQKMSYGSTIASAMFLFITLFSLVSIRLMNRKGD